MNWFSEYVYLCLEQTAAENVADLQVLADLAAETTGGAAGSAEHGTAADPAIVSAVAEMGFPRAHAAAAARATLNVSTEQAMEWCLRNPAPAGGDDHGPAPPPAAVSMPKLSPRGKGSTREDIIARRQAQKAVAAAAQAQEAGAHLSVWTGDASGTLTQWIPAAAFGDNAEPPTILRSFTAHGAGVASIMHCPGLTDGDERAGEAPAGVLYVGFTDGQLLAYDYSKFTRSASTFTPGAIRNISQVSLY